MVKRLIFILIATMICMAIIAGIAFSKSKTEEKYKDTIIKLFLKDNASSQEKKEKMDVAKSKLDNYSKAQHYYCVCEENCTFKECVVGG